VHVNYSSNVLHCLFAVRNIKLLESVM